MKVSELIKKLKSMPQDLVVCNEFSYIYSQWKIIELIDTIEVVDDWRLLNYKDEPTKRRHKIVIVK